MKSKQLIHLCLALSLFLLSECLQAKGFWTQVRKADWEFSLSNVFLSGNQTCFSIGSQQQVLFSTNHGATWLRYVWPDSMSGQFRGYFCDYDMDNGNDVWLLEGDGMLFHIPHDSKSPADWTLTIIPDRPSLQCLSFISPETGWLGGYQGEIYKTNNAGKSIDLVYNFNNRMWDIHFMDANTGVALVRTGEDSSRAYLTSNGGVSWSALEHPTVQGRTMYFLDDDHGWILGERYVVYATVDGGETWSEYSTTAGTERQNSIYFINAMDGWIVGDSGIVLRSTDGGASWSRVANPTANTIQDVHFSNAQQGWIVGAWGTILSTNDGGKSWQWQVKSPSNRLFDVHFINDRKGFAIGHHIFVKTNDGGDTWTWTDSLNGRHVQFVDSMNGWLDSETSIYASRDGGTHWQKQYSVDEPILFLQFIDTQTGWFITGNEAETNMYHTADGGNHWKHISTIDQFHPAFDFVNPKLGWIVGYKGRILHTNDGGRTWSLQRTGQDSFSDGLSAVDFVDSEHGWAAGMAGQIWTTQNGGKNWIEQTQQKFIENQFLALQFLNEKEGWIYGSYGEILYTTDSGYNWSDTYSPSSKQAWQAMQFTDRDHGWLVGNNGMISKYVNPTRISSERSFLSNADKIITLDCYPNPCNAGTTIHYTLSRNSPVKMDIFNSIGQHIKRLVSEVQQQGSYTITWACDDQSNTIVPSGTYFCKIETRTRVNFIRIVIMK